MWCKPTRIYIMEMRDDKTNNRLHVICLVSVDPCQHDRCLHGSTCIPKGAGYTCACLSGMWGDHCQFGSYFVWMQLCLLMTIRSAVFAFCRYCESKSKALSQKSETVSQKWDCLTFLRQCGQAIIRRQVFVVTSSNNRKFCPISKSLSR